jgi:ABC-2 type transport system ATP-binding protein
MLEVVNSASATARSSRSTSLSFSVADGQLYGFVGPNGAGKTTTMRIVLGVLASDAGEG